MTQIAAIAKALLEGQTLSIMTGFQKFYCTNLPRELSRSIEQRFSVEVSKERVDFTSRYGQKGYYFRYRLPHTEANKKGIAEMREYVAAQTSGEDHLPTSITVREHKRKIIKEAPAQKQKFLLDFQ